MRVLQFSSYPLLNSLVKQDVLPQSPLVAPSQLSTFLQHGCWHSVPQARDISRCPARTFPGCFLALHPATFLCFPLKMSVRTHLGDWPLPLIVDNTSCLVILNASPCLRSQFIDLHHFLHPTAGIDKDRQKLLSI